jgi:uncharacterized damage-inducible protein DinB
VSSPELQRIADQLDRAVNGPAWHGPAILPLVRGLSAKQAAARPIAKAHSIWELVAHTAAWLEIVRQRLEGNPPRVTAAMNWPPVHRSVPKSARPVSDTRRWRAEVDRLRQAAKDLRDVILALNDHRLADDVATTGTKWSGYVTLHGIVQHTLYHAGQIAILRKGPG